MAWDVWTSLADYLKRKLGHGHQTGGVWIGGLRVWSTGQDETGTEELEGAWTDGSEIDYEYWLQTSL